MSTLKKLHKDLISNLLNHILLQNLIRSSIRYGWENLVWETSVFFKRKEAGDCIICRKQIKNVD